MQLMAALETEVQFCASLQSKSNVRRRECPATREREQKLERHLEEETTTEGLKQKRQANSYLTRGAASQKLQARRRRRIRKMLGSCNIH